MKSKRLALSVLLSLVMGAAALFIGSGTAGAAYVKDIGGSDTLYAYSPSETAYVARAFQQPKNTNICTFLSAFRGLPTAVQMGCKAISALNWIDATRAKLFLNMAASRGECGAIVVDGGAWWRSDRIRPADGYVAGITTAVVGWAPGTYQSFKTSSGWQSVLCSR